MSFRLVVGLLYHCRVNRQYLDRRRPPTSSELFSYKNEAESFLASLATLATALLNLE